VLVCRREPRSIVKPIKDSEGQKQIPPEKEKEAKATVVRHIILIRHGQYNLSGKVDVERTLTEVG
jgi:serine/threonine-protein phosphatase PGAM5